MNDDALLEWLRKVAAEADPVPEEVAAAAREAIRLKDLDGQLAELVADSASTDSEYDTVRRAGPEITEERLLSFEGGEVRVELDISPSEDGLTIIGQLIGASAEGCALEYSDGNREQVQLDELGRFLLDGRQRGPMRIRCRSVRGSPVVTSWVNL